jgi:hypothetical protein
MATEYFGACDSSGAYSGTQSNSDPDFCFWRAYTCPGTGNKTITVAQISGYDALGSAPAGVRLGIYNAAGDTLLWDSGQFNVPATLATEAWSSPASLSGVPTLVGGTDYILAWASSNGSGSGVGSQHVDDSRSAGNYKSACGYYAGGFSASLPTPDSQYLMYPMRVGVDDAGGGPVAPTLFTVATPRWRR